MRQQPWLVRLWKRIQSIPRPSAVWYYAVAVWEWAKCGGRFAAEATAVHRHSICLGCPERIMEDGEETCSVCGCWVSLEKGWHRAYSKIYFDREECPKGYWEKEE